MPVLSNTRLLAKLLLPSMGRSVAFLLAVIILASHLISWMSRQVKVIRRVNLIVLVVICASVSICQWVVFMFNFLSGFDRKYLE